MSEWTPFTTRPPLGPILMIMRQADEEILSEIWLDRFVDEKLLIAWLNFIGHKNLWWCVYKPPIQHVLD